MKASPQSFLENSLKHREIELVKAKDKYDKLNFECRILRSAISILNDNSRNNSAQNSRLQPIAWQEKRFPYAQHSN